MYILYKNRFPFLVTGSPPHAWGDARLVRVPSGLFINVSPSKSLTFRVLSPVTRMTNLVWFSRCSVNQRVIMTYFKG